jgi:hypothetical protein
MHILLLFILFLQNQQPELSKLNGRYTGRFDEKNIQISLHHDGNGRISGNSKHRGVFRKLNGTAITSDTLFIVRLEEPGTTAYDGFFKLKLSVKSFSGSGEWRPKSDTLNTVVRFTLKKTS